LEYEKRYSNERLEKIRLLLKYFHEKMSEHNLSTNDTPSSELISSSITPFEEQTILSSYLGEQDYDNNLSIKTTTINQPTIAIAMKLPKNLTPLDVNSTTTTNEIIHSPYYQETSIEYKKELPTDILDKYAGVGKNQQQQQSTHGKKHKKNKKVILLTILCTLILFFVLLFFIFF